MKTAIVLYCKNEASLIGEFLAYHYYLGFDKTYVYLNGSNDGTREIIETVKATDPKWIDLIDWPDHIFPDHNERQVQAYNAALNRAKEDGIEWMLAIDTDEFFRPTNGENLHGLLSRLGHRAAIGINWAVFGSSGHIKRPKGLVQENYLARGDENFMSSRLIKSFVRVNYCQGFFNPHYASFGPEFIYVNPRDEPISWGNVGGFVDNVPPRFTPCYVAHYFCRSREEWAHKAARSNSAHGFITRHAETFTNHDRNEVLDFTALLYSEAIRKMMGELGLEVPELPAPLSIETAK